MAKDLDIARETAALERLKGQLKELVAADPDFVIELAEGETSLIEALDAMLAADALDAGLRKGIGDTIDTLKIRSERIAKRVETRRRLIAQAMEALEQTSLKRPIATLVMAKQAAKLVISDDTEVPVEYFNKEVRLVLDKDRLEAAIKDGQSIPGVRLDNAPPQLRISRK